MRPMYDAFFIDQSIAMNRRNVVDQLMKEDGKYLYVLDSSNFNIFSLRLSWKHTVNMFFLQERQTIHISVWKKFCPEYLVRNKKQRLYHIQRKRHYCKSCRFSVRKYRQKQINLRHMFQLFQEYRCYNLKKSFSMLRMLKLQFYFYVFKLFQLNALYFNR